ncbi:hypothetical protein Dsin_012820 [Dipteronia sinensis]|uniref:RNase H type-1 domain-containing protein n=1 Tax=Dipteronia sinensis TaxID=43782 RepID=A0AAE0AJM4_9ROSI|nr:hypothetical protein Dsin_012820 [Dipteronia sinensis]
MFWRFHVDNSRWSLQEFGRWQGSFWAWNVKLRREVLGWEHEQWSCFLAALNSIKVRKGIPDRMAWTFSPNGKFSVQSFRKCLEDRSQDNQGSSEWTPRRSTTSSCIATGRGSSGRHAVWESRNSRVFEDKEVSADYATDLVKFRVGWWFKHHYKGSLEPITTILLNLREICVDKGKVKRYLKEMWCPPYVNGLKFNVDGSSRGNPGPAGIRGVLRNSDGKILCLFSYHVGIEYSKTSEIMAILKALEVCTSRLVLVDRDIIIASDSKLAVDCKNKTDDFGSLNHVNLIYDIRGFLNILKKVYVIFNPRHSNSFADNLAKKGSLNFCDRLDWGDL